MKVAILGGGIGGCMAALQMANAFPDVEITLYERQKDLLQGTSDKTPGRMGLGFHYVHKDSAKAYLRQTITFVREFYEECSHLMIGQEFPSEHYLRNGRYFIVKDSLFPTKIILETYRELAEEYAYLVKQDPRNAVFGDPKGFYKVLVPKEYKNDVAPGIVDVAIETHEHLLDWPSFRSFLLEKLGSKGNIKIKRGCDVRDIDYSHEDSQYVVSSCVTGEKKGPILREPCDFLVNATWEWVDYFNSKLGHHRQPNEIRTNRAKVLVKVKLPDELLNKNSMFFCMGPHCMFSNMGDGYGMMTYAPETNKENSTSLVPSESYLAYVNGTIAEDERERLLRQLLLELPNIFRRWVKLKLLMLGLALCK